VNGIKAEYFFQGASFEGEQEVVRNELGICENDLFLFLVGRLVGDMVLTNCLCFFATHR
jgi:hypothetical protein